ncbi:MAG TPA: SpoIIE family protein phosphatase [Terriglobales bacterium]|nr:SpoIIE family protein phosphatase [Terriglobales bacterium]
MSTQASAQNTIIAPQEIPVLLRVEGDKQQAIPLVTFPFTIGRRAEKHLVISDPMASRDHAEIVQMGGEYYLLDLGSKHGTFVNGTPVKRHKLVNNDRLQFGSNNDRNFVVFQFGTSSQTGSPARELLSQISGIQVEKEASDLEKLAFFLEVARKLNSRGALDDVLVTLVEATLRITGADRGFVFLVGKDGELSLAAGRNSLGDELKDDTTISHSILKDAMTSASRVIITDTASHSDLAARQSIVAHDLRTVICMPLFRSNIATQSQQADPAREHPVINGVLYLDSRLASRGLSSLSRDILNTVATEAAALIETAQLAQAEQNARLYQKELAIAAGIQQRLMTVIIPEVHFAKLRARSLPCEEIGGDFYDAVLADGNLYLVLADICGKGVSAAILASILQGMIYSQLIAHVPLVEIATAVNRFLCVKKLGEKYATCNVLKITPGGECEFLNCGHVPPVRVVRASIMRPSEGNLPLGLIPTAEFETYSFKLEPRDRIVLVSDGVNEAQNREGEFFGDERLESTVLAGEDLFAAVSDFAQGAPPSDDCTTVELEYVGGPIGTEQRVGSSFLGAVTGSRPDLE